MDELQNYKTVFVVGNGFDLNLGLKTSYKDFMKSHWFSDIKCVFTKYFSSKNIYRR